MASGNEPYANRVFRLLETVLERTYTGAAEWTISADSDVDFHLDLPNGSISVISVDDNGAPPYRVEIANAEGRVVEALTTLQHAPTPDDDRFNNLLFDLYEAARRSSLQIDSVLDALLEDLQ